MSWEGGERARRRWATPAVIVGCLVAVVVLGTLVRQERPGPALTVETASPEPPRPTPTRRDPPTIRASPSPRTSELVERRQLRRLAEAGGVLWAASDAGVLARLDLASGELVTARVLSSAPTPWEQLVPVGDGVVVVTFGASGDATARFFSAPDAAPVELGEAQQAVASVTPARVWLIGAFPSGQAPVREVATDGTVTAQGALPATAHVRAAVQGGLLVESPGGLVVYDPVAQRGRRAGDGYLLAADHGRMVRHTCDSDLRCWIGVGSPEDPDAVRLPVTEAPGYAAALSPDGARLALVGYRDDRPSLTVVDLTSGAQRPLQAIPEGSDLFAWDPSGRWLLAPSGGTVRAWDMRSDAIVMLELGIGRVAAIAVR